MGAMIADPIPPPECFLPVWKAGPEAWFAVSSISPDAPSRRGPPAGASRRHLQLGHRRLGGPVLSAGLPAGRLPGALLHALLDGRDRLDVVSIPERPAGRRLAR